MFSRSVSVFRRFPLRFPLRCLNVRHLSAQGLLVGALQPHWHPPAFALGIASWRSFASTAEPPKALLEEHFISIQSNKVPLLNDLATYEASLPVRFHESEYLKLHELPHWVCAEDQQDLVKQLEAKPEKGGRRMVKYLAAPGAAGKTSAILPAFLESAGKEGGFTHYFYVAFSNNAEQRFVLDPPDPATNLNTATKQGAAFIFDCVKILLDSPDKKGPHEIPRNDKPPSTEQTELALTKYLQEKLSSNHKVLIHVDEHRKMCLRKDTDGVGAAFSRGAMATLASVPNVTVVATYTEQPPLPSQLSSGVCRDPATLPCLDIDQIILAVPELHFNRRKQFNREQRRLWATLRFRLAMKLKDLGLASLHRRGTYPNTERFLKEFQKAASHSDTTKALKACTQLCMIQLERPDLDVNAAKLLLGSKEKAEADWHRQVSNLVVVDGIVTASLERLLALEDPKFPVYDDGCTRLRNVIHSSDLIAQTPLEAAYTWALSCRAAVHGILRFELDKSPRHNVRCNQLKAGRIFPGDDSNIYDLSALQPNVIYYAEERVNLPTHPLADIFFRTSEGNLVLIDVTGGKAEKALKKEARLAAWIAQEQPNVPGTALHGVVLAPLVEGASTTSRNVQVVRSHDARELLGGLRQVFRWL